MPGDGRSGHRDRLGVGDQLSDRVGPLADGDDRVLVIEARSLARRLPYHPHKLTLVFSAMRHFGERLRDDKDATERAAIHERAAEIRRLAERGDR